MFNQPSLEIRQLITFNNSRRIHLSTLRRASKSALSKAITVADEHMLKGMATEAKATYQYYTDVESNLLQLRLEQVIKLTDDRRKYMTRIKQLCENASEAAILTVEHFLPDGCIDTYGWEFQYLRTWSQGRETWDITWDEE